MEKLFNTIFPLECLFCSSKGSSFCRKCLNGCAILPHSYCLVCDGHSIEGETHYLCGSGHAPSSIFSAFTYAGNTRECIIKAKYAHKEFHPFKTLIRDALVYASKCGVTYDNSYKVCSIPLSKQKYRSRGFNQADFIAKELSKTYDLSLVTKPLKRVRNTQAQFGKTKKERLKNVSQAFVCNESLKGENVVLVDDICTSGATLLSAAKALYKAGVNDIKCFTIAKKLKGN